MIKNKILVLSGKGGVGKSTVAVHLAAGLADRQYKVGLVDIDLHGPSIPRMLGLDRHTFPGDTDPEPVVWNQNPNLSVISIEFMLPKKDRSIVWRGPFKMSVIQQFLSESLWDELDFLVIDSPPGTGDEPLSVAQQAADAKVVLVTTPQEVALADVRKSIDFCRQVRLTILGVVENMSEMVCPHCHESVPLFKTGNDARRAEDLGLPLLGRIPFRPEILVSGEIGRPDTIAFAGVVEKVLNRIQN